MKTYEMTSKDEDGKPEDYFYISRETSEVVCVRMSFTERMKRESSGFLDLPDGTEARYSLTENVLRSGDANKRRRSSSKRTRAKWPIRTVLTGVGEGQTRELRDFITERGLRGTHVHEDGSVEWSGPQARRDYCKAVGLYDKNAGYGDPAPDNL